MRALVTGGAGFIGSHLVDALVAEGHEISVVDNLVRGNRAWVNTSARFFESDVEDPALSGLVRESRADVIFHLAAQIDVRSSVRDPLADARANVLGTVNVLQAARESGDVRVVFASSGGTVYGETEAIPTPEHHACAPESAYGASKLSAELYGDMFQRVAGLVFVALRYGNVYGPRQDPHGEAGAVAIFASRCLRGEQSVINGDGKQTRDYVYVDDVVRANLNAAGTGVSGAFNVGTGIETDVNELYTRVARACGVVAPAEHGPAKPGEQRRSALAIDRARAGLAWEPEIDLDEGLRRTVDFFRDA